MTKLEELIAEYCPNGVEYVTLKEAAIMQRGTSITKAQANTGEHPVISGGKEPAFYCDNYNREGETVTVAGSGAGYVQYWNKPIFANDCFTLKGNEQVCTKYLYYFLANIQGKISDSKKGGVVPHVHISDIENFVIPVPPLPVQREIVRILDNFTELTTELTAELTARKKQYEYYRDELLSSKTAMPCEVHTLEQLCEKVSNIKWEKGETKDYIDLSSVDISTSRISETAIISDTEHPSRAQQIVKKGDILFGTTRPLLKRLTVVPDRYDGQICSTGYCVIRVDQSKVLPKWIFYNLQRECFYDYVEKHQIEGSYPSITNVNVLKYSLAIPSLEFQKKITDTLDHFDSICADLKIGLPAEIEARQKQYEYYRDLLLTFAEGSSQIVNVEREREREREQGSSGAPKLS